MKGHFQIQHQSLRAKGIELEGKINDKACAEFISYGQCVMIFQQS